MAHADSKGSGAPPLAAAAAAAPNKSSQSSASGFKGFGLPPGTCSTVSGSGSSSSTAVAATASAGRKGLAAAAAARSDVPVLRIFLYAAEAAKTKTSIEEAGLLGQVRGMPCLRVCLMSATGHVRQALDCLSYNCLVDCAMCWCM